MTHPARLLRVFVIAAALAATTSLVHAQAPVPVKEHHPDIRKAINALERAKTDLQSAKHDFGGHRAAALAECDRAIEQLKVALQFDK